MLRRLLPLLMLLLVTASCRTALNESITQSIDVDYPEATPVRVALATDAGSLEVRGTSVSGIAGEITTNVERWQADVATTGDTISISRGDLSAAEVSDGFSNWDLQLGEDTPVELEISAGDADADLEFGALSLPMFELSSENGRFTVRYDEPVANIEAGDGEIVTRNGDIEVTGLLDAFLERLSIETNGGVTQLTFDGEALRADLDVMVESGSGEVVLRIPDGLPTRVVFRTASGVAQQVDPEFSLLNGEAYETATYSTTDETRLLIEIRTISGDLRLITIGQA